MVAALKPPPIVPQGTPQIVHGQSMADQIPAAQISQYKLEQATADYNLWQTNILAYKQAVTLALDDAYELRQPTTPFFQLNNLQGQPTVYQYVSPIIRNYLDAALDYIRPEDLRIRCPADDNPAATIEERSDTEGSLRFVLDFHIRNRLGNIYEDIKFLTALRGMSFVQVSWLESAVAAKSNRRFPMRVDVHDMTDCAWHLGEDGAIKQIIILKKKLASELPAAWLATAAITDMNSEVDVLEYWDETSSGALINGTICKPLALHGYMDDNGDPFCPFVAFLHKPRRQRIGQIGPLASGVSQRGVIMGTPLCEALLPVWGADSRLKTRTMHYINLLRGILVSKGIKIRDNVAALDFDAMTAELDEDPNSSLSWLSPPNLAPMFEQALGMVQQDISSASATPGTLGGQVQQQTSAVSANHQTSWARSRAESFAISLEEGYGALGMMMVNMMRAHLVASAADHAEALTGKAPTVIPTKEADAFWHGSGKPLPFYKGGGVRPITPLTLANIDRIVVDIEPDTRTPQEVEVQQALAMEKSQLVDLDWVRANKLHIDNVQATKDAIILQRMEQDANSPWGQFRQAEAAYNMLVGDIDDPGQQQQYAEALDQRRMLALQQILQGGGGQPQPAQGQVPPGVGQPPPNQGFTPGQSAAPPAPPPAIANMPPGQPGGPQFQPPQLLAQQGAPPTMPMPPQQPIPFQRPGLPGMMGVA